MGRISQGRKKTDRKRGQGAIPLSDDEHSTKCDASGDFGVILIKHHPVYRRTESEHPKEPQQQQQPEQNHNDEDSLVRRLACIGCIPEVSEWIEERTGLELFGRTSTDLTKSLNGSDTSNTEDDSMLSNPELLHRKDASLLTDVSFLTDASLIDLVLDDEQEDVLQEETAPKQKRKMKLPAFRRSIFDKDLTNHPKSKAKAAGMKTKLQAIKSSIDHHRFSGRPPLWTSKLARSSITSVFQKKKNNKKDPSSSRPGKSKIMPGLRKMMART